MSQIPIIDSHIHLFPSTHLPTLSWTSSLPPDHVLNRGHTISDYKVATAIGQRPQLRGFVFLETDRKSGLSDSEWEHPLAEAAFLSRIAQGTPLPGEGHELVDEDLVLGVVPWAPVPAGRGTMGRYMARVWELYPGELRDRVKGVRYLLQDKPQGTMLGDGFVDSLVWLGEQGLSFDLGVDARSTGLWQLEDARVLLGRLYSARTAKTRVVINHFCKPNLKPQVDGELQGHEGFVRWKSAIENVARWPLTYMKLSGLFSEMPEQEDGQPEDVQKLIQRMKPWAEVVFNAFTPERIMFGSDWPVCNVGGPGAERSWSHWHDVVTALLQELELDEDAQRRIWYGTAAEAYRIDLSQ